MQGVERIYCLCQSRINRYFLSNSGIHLDGIMLTARNDSIRIILHNFEERHTSICHCKDNDKSKHEYSKTTAHFAGAKKTSHEAKSACQPNGWRTFSFCECKGTKKYRYCKKIRSPMDF